MKTLYVVSHTEAEHHRENLVGGWHDSRLTTKGLEDAENIARTLADEDEIQTVYSSDLKRARSTADAIVRASGCRLVVSDALREMSFGSAEGKPQRWLDERIQPEDGANRLDHRIVEGAETRRELAERVFAYLDTLDFTGTSAISTHSFAATFFIAWWIRMPIDSLGYVNFGITPGRISRLVEDDFFRNRTIAYLNR